jgi:hypothetical protein
VAAIDSSGRTIFVADAHRDGQRLIVPADEKLAAFLELESDCSGVGFVLAKSAGFFVKGSPNKPEETSPKKQARQEPKQE